MYTVNNPTQKIKISLLLLLYGVAIICHAGLPNSTTLVLNTTGYPPLSNDARQGFLDRVATQAFRRVGVELKIVKLPAERALLNANKHSIDGEICRIAGLQNVYPNLVAVPEEIMVWEFVAIGKPGLKTQSGWGSLHGYNVAIINGWKILEKNISPIASVTKVKDAPDLFRLLNHHRADYIVYERWAGAKHLQDMRSKENRIIMPALARRSMYIYLARQHADLVHKLAKALRSMKKDGSYKKIHKEVLGPYQNP